MGEGGSNPRLAVSEPDRTYFRIRQIRFKGIKLRLFRHQFESEVKADPYGFWSPGHGVEPASATDEVAALTLSYPGKSSRDQVAVEEIKKHLADGAFLNLRIVGSLTSAFHGAQQLVDPPEKIRLLGR